MLEINSVGSLYNWKCLEGRSSELAAGVQSVQSRVPESRKCESSFTPRTVVWRLSSRCACFEGVDGVKRWMQGATWWGTVSWIVREPSETGPGFRGPERDNLSEGPPPSVSCVG